MCILCVFYLFCKVRHICGAPVHICCTAEPRLSYQSLRPHTRFPPACYSGVKCLDSFEWIMNEHCHNSTLWLGVGVEKWILVKFKQNLTIGNFSEIPKATSSWVCFLSVPHPSCIFHALVGLRRAEAKNQKYNQEGFPCPTTFRIRSRKNCKRFNNSKND